MKYNLSDVMEGLELVFDEKEYRRIEKIAKEVPFMERAQYHDYLYGSVDDLEKLKELIEIIPEIPIFKNYRVKLSF